MPKVFVVQDDGRFNLDDTKRYGDVVRVFRRDLYPDNANELMPNAMQTAYDILVGFNPEADYLCLVGSPLYVAICMYALGDMGKSPVKLLRFDRIEQSYYEIVVR